MNNFQVAQSSAAHLREFIEAEENRASAQDPMGSEGRVKKCGDALQALKQLEDEVDKLALRLFNNRSEEGWLKRLL